MSPVRRRLIGLIEAPDLAPVLADCDLWAMVGQMVPIAECCDRPEHVMVARVDHADVVQTHPTPIPGEPTAIHLHLTPVYLPPGTGPAWATEDGPTIVPLSMSYQRNEHGDVTIVALVHTTNLPASKEPAA